MGKYMLMPKLDMSMEEGVIVKWLSNVGDTIKRGDIVIEIETGKVSLEVDNPVEDGVVLAQYFEAGDEVDVNVPIMYIGDASETAPSKEEAIGASAGAETTEEANSESTESNSSTTSTSDDFDYDFVVIGGGPGGYVSAIRAAQLGANVALIEKDQLGGVCLNRGCIPTKSFLKNAEVLRTIKESESMGITVDNYSVDWSKVISRKNQVVNTLTSGVGALLKKNKVKVFNGAASVVSNNEIKVDNDTFTAKYIVVATGTIPMDIPIKTDGSIPCYDSTEMLDINNLPKDLVIVGGGVIGVEMATVFNSFGVNVTIVELLDTILAPVDQSVKEFMTKKLTKDGINIETGTKIEEINKNEVVLSNGTQLKADGILISIGRKPISNIFEEISVDMDEKGFIAVDEYMTTSINNVFAIGDVTGKSLLAHTASKQGIVVAESLFGDKKPMDYKVIPSCIFTSPEIASVGMTEDEVKSLKINYKTSSFPFAAIGKALAMNETEGFVKVIVDDKYGELLGVHIVGPHASDLIAEGALAMTSESTYETVAETIHAHPTLAESIMEACEGIDSKAIHI